ncbi:hypothetical protein [Streptomyces sp. NPDC047108]|uniref:hypothetical protein n=1 Tax=Streptomyces sp. NPDC047108 TaxID=3155025 RepID=UPI0033E08FEC
MPPESALLESRALRDSLTERTGVLEKVKAPAMLPDGLHVTTRMVAAYFEVSEDVIRQLVARHRPELTVNGLITLHGSDLHRFKRDIMSRYPRASYPQARSNLTLFTRRAVLNVAMLLRDSEVARRVRTYLLDTEETSRTSGHPAAGYVSLEALVGDAASKAAERIVQGPIGDRLTAVETGLGEVGSALRELGPVIAGISVRLERIDQRLDATNRVVCAMSERLSGLGEDMKDVRHDVSVLGRDVAELKQRSRRPGHGRSRGR